MNRPLDGPPTGRARVATAILALLPLALAGCHESSSPSGPATAQTVTGVVTTAWGEPVAGAVVYLVPADAVPTTPITAAAVLSGAAQSYDEPLEDAINGPSGSTFPRATTGATGSFELPDVNATESYFSYVAVAGATPANLYPGGDRSRVAIRGTALLGLAIEVTGHPTSAATYIGSTACVVCHSSYATQAKHAHRLGFRVPGQNGALQDTSRIADFDDGVTFFKDATSADFKTNGTSLFYHTYDGSRGFDKFIISPTDPGGSEVRVYLWRDTATSEHKVTMENLVNSEADRTFVVDLTYGGALKKQRFMLQVPGASFAGRYPFLQFQHDGDDGYYDRTRRVWRDYHMDYFWDGGTQMFKDPPKTVNIESNCMACHTTGYRYFDDSMTGERLADGVNDPSGVFDIDGDGMLDEINTGCEVCHGPGSEHAAVARPQFIIKPQDLSPSRENMICGRCHARPAGNDDLQNGQPLNAAGEMAPPGTSRAQYLTDYTTRAGPALSSLWADEVHSKSHRQQYEDFIKSGHYRNDERLVVCSDCHDLHGQGAFDGELTADPRDGALCAQCHVLDVAEHVEEQTGSTKLGQATQCTTCHYSKVAKTGAGRPGLLLGAPTGAASDEDIVYWENDTSSHLTLVPSRFDQGVAGTKPGKAMPVPYTNRCGSCHDASSLPFQK